MCPWQPVHNVSELLLDPNQDSVIYLYYFCCRLWCYYNEGAISVTCSAGRKTITLSKTLACNCNSLWHTLYKYLMHVDIEVVLTMPRILYLLSQTCKHPALHFSLAASLVERRGEYTSSMLRSLFTAGLRPSLTQGKVRDVVIAYIFWT